MPTRPRRAPTRPRPDHHDRGDHDRPTRRTTTSSTTTSTSTTTTVPVVVRKPLTGEPVSSADEIIARPALVVKIDNHPQARPQSGLNKADIVFEEIVEGTLTRFAAVFHSSDADPVGPIRSGRSQDVDMLGPLNGPVFAWSGGNGGVRNLIRNSDFINLDAGFTPGYYRRSGRGGAPHNLYSSTAALWANVPPEEMGPRRPSSPTSGRRRHSRASRRRASTCRWTAYACAGSGTRRRRLPSLPERQQPRDRGDGQVVADNLVVMGVDYHRARSTATVPRRRRSVGSGVRVRRRDDAHRRVDPPRPSRPVRIGRP